MNKRFKYLVDLSKLREKLTKSLISFHKNINASFGTLAEISRDLPKKTNITQKFLARRGWFIPFRFLSLPKLNWMSECIIEEKDFEKIESFLIEYIEDLAPRLIDYSEKCFTERFRILEEAFQAHNEERYALSIPTFLSQADGMFRDLFGKDFYKNNPDERNKISRRIKKKLNQGESKITAASLTYLFVKQLHEESSLHEPFGETEIFEEAENVETLNRHEVLHGVAKKYDTQRNSVKAIGLIELLIMTKKTLTERGAV